MRSCRRIAVLLVLMSGFAALNSAVAQAATLDRVRDGGTLRIGFREDAAPFSFLNANGRAAGYMVDLCNHVAARVKSALSLAELTVEYVAVTASNRFDAIREGRIDILCGPTSVTMARRVLVDFSLYTFVDGASVLSRVNGPGSFSELAGKKVAVRGGTTTADALKNTIASQGIEVEVEVVDSHDTGLARLESGLVAAYFADRTILARLMSTSTKAEALKLSSRYYTHESYALALPRGDTEFRLLVDDTLAGLYRDGEIAKIFAHSFGADTQPGDALIILYRLNALPQ